MFKRLFSMIRILWHRLVSKKALNQESFSTNATQSTEDDMLQKNMDNFERKLNDLSQMDCCMIINIDKSSMVMMYLIPYEKAQISSHTFEFIEKTGLTFNVLKTEPGTQRASRPENFNPFEEKTSSSSPSLKFPSQFFNLN